MGREGGMDNKFRYRKKRKIEINIERGNKR